MNFVVGIIGAVFFCVIGVLINKLTNVIVKQSNEVYSEEVDARVIKRAEFYERFPNEIRMKNHTYYEYEYDGQDYLVFSYSTRNKAKDHVTLYINPAKPEQFYCRNESIAYIFFSMLGNVMYVFAALWIIISITR